MKRYGRDLGWIRSKPGRKVLGRGMMNTNDLYGTVNTRWTAAVRYDYELFRDELASKYDQHGCFWNGKPLYCEAPDDWAQEDKPRRVSCALMPVK